MTLVEAPRAEAEELESDVGFHAQEITETIVRQNRLATRRGAYVSFVASGSPAAEAGLEPGDVIRRVEGRDVENLAELRTALAGAEKLPRFLVTAERGEETRLVLLRRGARAERRRRSERRRRRDVASLSSRRQRRPPRPPRRRGRQRARGRSAAQSRGEAPRRRHPRATDRRDGSCSRRSPLR